MTVSVHSFHRFNHSFSSAGEMARRAGRPTRHSSVSTLLSVHRWRCLVDPDSLLNPACTSASALWKKPYSTFYVVSAESAVNVFCSVADDQYALESDVCVIVLQT